MVGILSEIVESRNGAERTLMFQHINALTETLLERLTKLTDSVTAQPGQNGIRSLWPHPFMISGKSGLMKKFSISRGKADG